MINRYIVDRTVKTLLLNTGREINIPVPGSKEDIAAVREILDLMGVKYTFHSMGKYMRATMGELPCANTN